MKKKIAVIGYRSYTNHQAILKGIQDLPEDTLVISGGAKGVDQTAIGYAKMLGLATQEINADWTTGPLTLLKKNKAGQYYDPGAGLKRNIKIVEAADQVIGYWDGQSRGTLHTLNIAKDAGKLTAVYDPYGNEIPLDSIPKFESKKKS